MKTKLLFTLLFAFAIQFSSAQMTIHTGTATDNGNNLYFQFIDILPGDIWDANGNPINLYVWVDAADVSNGEFHELAGAWPGTAMIENQFLSDFYDLTLDLSSFLSCWNLN